MASSYSHSVFSGKGNPVIIVCTQRAGTARSYDYPWCKDAEKWAGGCGLTLTFRYWARLILNNFSSVFTRFAVQCGIKFAWGVTGVIFTSWFDIEAILPNLAVDGNRRAEVRDLLKSADFRQKLSLFFRFLIDNFDQLHLDSLPPHGQPPFFPKTIKYGPLSYYRLFLAMLAMMAKMLN